MEETRINERTDSIKLSRTSKGLYSHEIKIYYNGTDTNPNEIIEKIDNIDKKLKETFKGDVK